MTLILLAKLLVIGVLVHLVLPSEDSRGTSGMFVVRPMVWRELLRESRHWTHFAWRALIAVALGAVVLLVGLSPDASDAAAYLPAPGAAGNPPGITPVQATMAQIGTRLFTIWAVGQYAALCVLATVRAASLAEERRAGRLPLLAITGLGDRGVILGLYASILVRSLFTTLLMLPVLALARSFGGFTVEQAVEAVGIGFIAAANAAALTLALASFVSGTASAVVLSAIVQAASLAVFGIGFVASRFDQELTGALTGALIHSSGLLLYIVKGTSPAWNVLVCFVLLRVLLCRWFLKRAMGRVQQTAADPGRRLKRALTAMDQYFQNFAGRGGRVLWKSGLGECRGNPIYWRERAISVIGQRDHMIRILYGSGAVLCAVFAIAMVFRWEGGILVAGVGAVGLPMLLAGLLMLVQPALAFSRERERGGLATLALTPMTPRQFVMGKYLYALRSAAVPLAVGVGFGCLVTGLPFVRGNENTVWGFPLLFILIMAPLAMALILYVAAGARSAVAGIIGGVAVIFCTALAIFEVARQAEWHYMMFGTRMPLYGRPVNFAIAFLLLLSSILMARRSKWMRNGLVIGLFALAPVALNNIVPEMETYAWKSGILAGLLVRLMLLLALWRAARYADAGVFNRAFVAVALVAAAFSFLAGPLGLASSRLSPLLIVPIVGGAIAFLHFTVRQFNQLVERNG